MVGITYYRHKCIGCRACAEYAGQRWQMSKKDGKAVLIGGVRKRQVIFTTVPPEELASNLKAAENCPEKCIRVQHISPHTG